MENKSKGIENKKLGKILFIVGFSLLIVFIGLRIAFKVSGDHVTDMPSVGELSYKPKRIEEKSKVEQFEEERQEKQRHEMGFKDENNYVVPNFNEFIRKSEVPAPSDPTEKVVSSQLNSNSTQSKLTPAVKQIKPTPVESTQNKGATKAPNSKLNYKSDYFTVKKEEQVFIPASMPLPAAATSQNKSPFGTISTDNIQKSLSSGTGLYTGELYGDQKIENGGMVMLRSTESFIFQGTSLPKNSIFYGQAAFEGNRVLIKISRVKTSKGELNISLTVFDNDRIEGIYNKAPIDEAVSKTKDEMNVPQIPGQYGGLINSIAQGAIRQGKELAKKAATLNLEDGYKIYLSPLK